MCTCVCMYLFSCVYMCLFFIQSPFDKDISENGHNYMAMKNVLNQCIHTYAWTALRLFPTGTLGDAMIPSGLP